MYRKFIKNLNRLHLGQKGMTGLETAIILIAFVTVASVLAYSVLSAGIFSAEKAKESVYKGLEQAGGTIEITGNVLGLSGNQSELESVQFFIGLVMPNEHIDTNAIIVNYWDADMHYEGCSLTTELANNSNERGAAELLEFDEQFVVTVTIPDTANAVGHDTFNLQLLPPKGEPITITKTLPGGLLKVMDLK